MLPSELSGAIAELTRDVGSLELARAVGELSSQYRAEGRSRPQLTKAHRIAYLITRLPATYAVISRLFREVEMRIPSSRIESMLDLGAGPGTAMWAACEVFANLNHVTLIEDTSEWIEIGKRLGAKRETSVIGSANWQQKTVTDDLPAGSADLVSLSYVLNEIRAAEQVNVALSAWERTNKVLVIVEPGTPEGFKSIRKIRCELIRTGARLIAPCPHANQCPIAAGDWCHFSERLERTSAHRGAKKAELGYEDEKYSYVIFTREAVALPSARILRHPRKHSGHIEFELCTAEGLKRETISRKQGERYSTAKRAEWGDTL